MNKEHLAFCASEEWRQALEQWILPWALADIDLGADVIEVGSGPGLSTDKLRQGVERLTAVELDADLASALRERLEAAGFGAIDVHTNEYGWMAHARKP